jgi:hypothetical protein
MEWYLDAKIAVVTTASKSKAKDCSYEEWLKQPNHEQSKQTNDQLKKWCEANGLKKSGTKAQLIVRLKDPRNPEHQCKVKPVSLTEDDIQVILKQEYCHRSQLEKYTCVSLSAIIKALPAAKGLKVSGTKTQLIDRIVDNWNLKDEDISFKTGARQKAIAEGVPEGMIDDIAAQLFAKNGKDVSFKSIIKAYNKAKAKEDEDDDDE